MLVWSLFSLLVVTVTALHPISSRVHLPKQSPIENTIRGLLLSGRQSGPCCNDGGCCSVGEFCGVNGCCVDGETACQDLVGGCCPSGTYCVPNGCCPNGKICGNGPGVITLPNPAPPPTTTTFFDTSTPTVSFDPSITMPSPTSFSFDTPSIPSFSTTSNSTTEFSTGPLSVFTAPTASLGAASTSIPGIANVGSAGSVTTRWYNHPLAVVLAVFMVWL